MSQQTVSTEKTLSNLCTTGKVKVPCHPRQLYRLRCQWQADPQDHGGQGEQEGSKLISGYSSGWPDNIRRSLQVNSQVKNRRKEKYK